MQQKLVPTRFSLVFSVSHKIKLLTQSKAISLREMKSLELKKASLISPRSPLATEQTKPFPYNILNGIDK